MNKELKPCENCGKTIKKDKYTSWPRYSKQKYCSPECTYAALKKEKRGWWNKKF